MTPGSLRLFRCRHNFVVSNSLATEFTRLIQILPKLSYAEVNAKCKELGCKSATNNLLGLLVKDG